MGEGEEPKGGFRFVLSWGLGFGREWVCAEALSGKYVNLFVSYLVRGCT